MGHSTSSQGLAAFKFNMAACGMFEIWLFYPIWRPATSWKVLRYHLERCIVFSSYFTTTEWQNNRAFYEKEEAQSCGHAYDEDTKLKVVALISTLLVFTIVSIGL